MIQTKPMNAADRESNRNARVHYVNSVGFSVQEAMSELGDNNCTLHYVPSDHNAEHFEINRTSISVYPLQHPERGVERVIAIGSEEDRGLALKLKEKLEERYAHLEYEFTLYEEHKKD